MATGVNQREESLFSNQLLTTASATPEEQNKLVNIALASEMYLWVRNRSTSTAQIGFKVETLAQASSATFLVDGFGYTGTGASARTALVSLDPSDEKVLFFPIVSGFSVATAGYILVDLDDSTGTQTTSVLPIVSAAACPPMTFLKLTVESATTNGTYNFDASVFFRG